MVNKDRSVIVERRLFEAPVALIGKKVEILYHEESPEEVEIRYQEKSWGLLRQVDLHVNSRVKRDKNGQIELSGEGACEKVLVQYKKGGGIRVAGIDIGN